jgi:hypothetical protein
MESKSSPVILVAIRREAAPDLTLWLPGPSRRNFCPTGVPPGRYHKSLAGCFLVEVLEFGSKMSSKGPWVEGLSPAWCYWKVVETLGSGPTGRFYIIGNMPWTPFSSSLFLCPTCHKSSFALPCPPHSNVLPWSRPRNSRVKLLWIKTSKTRPVWWLLPIIPATWEAEMGKIEVSGQLGQNGL